MNEVKVILGPLLFSFRSFDHWCDKARSLFEAYEISGKDVLCLDSKGRVCSYGKQFMTARDEGSFPINVYAIECTTEGKPEVQK